MAEYIDDAGAYSRDALFSGTKGTDYDYDDTEEAVWFSSTGQASTGFTLPDSEWLLYEVYDMTGTGITNSLSGSTKLRGKTEWTSTIGTVLTTINAWRTAFNSGQGANYTTYEVIVTHYKGSDVADTYEADETTAFSTATITDGDFTDHSATWLLKDELLADLVIDEVTEYVTNGKFDSVTTGWTPANNATLSIDTQRLKIVHSSGGWALAYQSVTGLNASTQYTCSGDFTFGDMQLGGLCSVKNAADDTEMGTSSNMASTQSFSFDFYPDTGDTSVILKLVGNTGFTNDYHFWDNISIVEKV